MNDTVVKSSRAGFMPCWSCSQSSSCEYFISTALPALSSLTSHHDSEFKRPPQYNPGLFLVCFSPFCPIMEARRSWLPGACCSSKENQSPSLCKPLGGVLCTKLQGDSHPGCVCWEPYDYIFSFLTGGSVKLIIETYTRHGKTGPSHLLKDSSSPPPPTHGHELLPLLWWSVFSF